MGHWTSHGHCHCMCHLSGLKVDAPKTSAYMSALRKTSINHFIGSYFTGIRYEMWQCVACAFMPNTAPCSLQTPRLQSCPSGSQIMRHWARVMVIVIVWAISISYLAVPRDSNFSEWECTSSIFSLRTKRIVDGSTMTRKIEWRWALIHST